jgi:ParB-like chromosome segregation protein Spo0J
MHIELWPIGGPKPYAKNPRKWSKKAVQKIAQSIREFGFRQPVVCDVEDVIVIGHLRMAASRHLGLKEVPVPVASGLTPAQINALRIADTRLNEESDWVEELLIADRSDLNGRLALTCR